MAKTARASTPDHAEVKVSALLAALVKDAQAQGETVTLGALVDRLGERAFGLVLLVLALPCAVPFLYGIPQVVSLPMLLVGFQLARGDAHLWLPEQIRRRKLQTAELAKMVKKAKPWLVVLDAFARPSLTGWPLLWQERAHGVVLLIAAASICVPLPLTNTVPGVGVALLGMGLVARDGRLLLLGTAVALGWIFLLISGLGMLIGLIAG